MGLRKNISLAFTWKRKYILYTIDRRLSAKLLPTCWYKCVAWSAQRIPTAFNLSFLYRSRDFSILIFIVDGELLKSRSHWSKFKLIPQKVIYNKIRNLSLILKWVPTPRSTDRRSENDFRFSSDLLGYERNPCGGRRISPPRLCES
jgi:hypothetical protein